MSTFDDQTDFSFLSIAETASVKTGKRSPGRNIEIGNQTFTLGYARGPLSAEQRAKISRATRGKTISAETRAKTSQSLQGNTNGAGNRGKTISAETRAKISRAMQGRSAYNCRQIMTPYGIFPSQKKAAQALTNGSVTIIAYRRKTQSQDYYYIEQTK
jgi:hypothetical protein